MGKVGMMTRSASIYDFDTIQQNIERIRKEEGKDGVEGALNGVDSINTTPTEQPNTNYSPSYY